MRNLTLAVANTLCTALQTMGWLAHVQPARIVEEAVCGVVGDAGAYHVVVTGREGSARHPTMPEQHTVVPHA